MRGARREPCDTSVRVGGIPSVAPADNGSFDDRYLPLRALVAYSGLSVRTLRGYLRHPAMPLAHYRVGGKILIRRSEFDAWIARFRVAPAGGLDRLVGDTLDGFGVRS